MKKVSDKKKLVVQVRRAMRRANLENLKDPSKMREVVIEAVADVYRQNGETPPMDEISNIVREVISDDELEGQPKKKIPLHYWVLGGIVAIPLAVPIIRLTEAAVMVLLRVFI